MRPKKMSILPNNLFSFGLRAKPAPWILLGIWVAVIGFGTNGRSDDNPFSLPSRIYCQEDNHGSHEFTWRIESGGDMIRVISSDDREEYRNLVSSDGRTFAWKYHGEGVTVEAELAPADTLRIHGESNGTPISEQVSLDGIPWYQALSFSLARQLTTDTNEWQFWMIRPDNLKAVRLVAHREAVETLRLDGQDNCCRRIRVTGTGLIGSKWHCHYWFRTADSVFVRYEGLFGFPGLPKTTIELKNAETGQPFTGPDWQQQGRPDRIPAIPPG